MCKVDFDKKPDTSYWEVFVPFATQECDVTTPSYLISAIWSVKWSLTRGSKYSDLNGKLLMLWKTGRREEVVTCERWSQPEVPTVCKTPLTFSLKRSSQKTFFIPKFALDTINEICTSCSFNFEITRAITLWIELHSVQLLLLTVKWS